MIPGYRLEPIRPEFDLAIARIIRQTGIEFGAIGEGFGPSDTEVSAMSRHYDPRHKSQYLVARVDGQVVGGCGIAPFNGSATTCELRKLFLLPQSRGQGIGKALTLACLAFARTQGFERCYLDTLEGMSTAIDLYRALGFDRLEGPLEGTPHGGCDVWMLKTL
ncbi:MAG: putative acetyltransferase [Motiliproteus sp.]|jgi:putative acetyltransferase